jgi:hypothetical protein
MNLFDRWITRYKIPEFDSCIMSTSYNLEDPETRVRNSAKNHSQKKNIKPHRTSSSDTAVASAARGSRPSNGGDRPSSKWRLRRWRAAASLCTASGGPDMGFASGGLARTAAADRVCSGGWDLPSSGDLDSRLPPRRPGVLSVTTAAGPLRSGAWDGDGRPSSSASSRGPGGASSHTRHETH